MARLLLADPPRSSLSQVVRLVGPSGMTIPALQEKLEREAGGMGGDGAAVVDKLVRYDHCPNFASWCSNHTARLQTML